MRLFESMATVIPEGTADGGTVRVQHRHISEAEARFDAIRAAWRGYVPCQEGSLCCLLIDGGLMMSDGCNEHRTNEMVVHKARGDVLIAGLGLGMILLPILRKPEVRTVTVIEKYAGVIELVKPALQKHLGVLADKLTIITADIFTWKPAEHACFDTIYFDIWPDICIDNLAEITRLRRRFTRRLRLGGWMGAWVEHHLRQKKRLGKWR